jgi:hypothetical protein
MKTTLTWLLAGAAVTLCAGVALAADPPKPAAKDAAAKTERREVHIYRLDGEERIVIDKDGEHREFFRNDGSPRRFEMSRGPDGERTIIFRDGGGRAENLRNLLQLRPEQEPALKAFLDASAQGRHADHMVRFERGADSRTTTERLAEMEQQMAEQQASMRRRIDATRAFYNQLDARQKKAFDAMPMLMMVGPGMGPMIMPISHRYMDLPRMPPIPPIPPVPPVPPVPPQDDDF